MNNEEKILPENEAPVQNTDTEKKLSKGALIGIIGGAVALVAIIVVLLVVLLGGNKTPECIHVDKDDDYLCDLCGEHFDDGDEIPEKPVATTNDVTFIVKLDDGTVVPGAKFAIVRGETRIDLVSDANGKATATLERVAYSVDYETDTLPEYCMPDTFGFKVVEDTNEITLVVIDNKPNGTMAKPFPVLESEIAVTIGANQELVYIYRGSSMKLLSIDNADVIIKYGDEERNATADDPIYVVPSDIGQATYFTLKNPTNAEISCTLHFDAPLGSSENPIEVDENGATVRVNPETIEYYSYTVTKDGVITLSCDNERNSITLTRIIMKNGEPIPQTVQTNGLSSVSMEVKEGDVITIGVSALEANDNHQNKDYEIEISFTISIE